MGLEVRGTCRTAFGFALDDLLGKGAIAATDRFTNEALFVLPE